MPRPHMRHAAMLIGCAAVLGSAAAHAQTVRITPYGSHAGELCAADRAMVFEDPTGVRILYDIGNSVTGGDDARIGAAHVVLLSHAHGDHIGDRKLAALGAGTCAAPELVPAGSNSNTADAIAAKGAAAMMIADMAVFIAKKVQGIRGKPVPMCAGDVVPYADPCNAGVQLGGSRTFRMANAARGVEVTVVPASHANNVPRSLLSDPEKANLATDETSLALGPPSGYVVKFTNGLTVYLSGDTGLHSDMKLVVHDFHKPNLVVLNLGPNAIAPAAAAYAINDIIQPAAVVLSHVNEAATAGAKALPASRTKAFMDLVPSRPVYLSLSGRTLEFDGNAKCVAGC